MTKVHRYLKDMPREARTEFALSYPFEVPRASFCLEGNTAHAVALSGVDLAKELRLRVGTEEVALGDYAASKGYLEGPRTAVVASGSNASPNQLARKFAALPGLVPTVKAELQDFAVVHTAKITAYGSVPSTVHPMPGATAEVFVNFLNSEQLEAMHQTEALGIEYEFCRLEGARLTLAGSNPLTEVYSYISRAGAFEEDGKPITLQTVPHHNTALTSADQRGAQGKVSTRLAWAGSLNEFVDGNIHDPVQRKRHVAQLKMHGLQFPGLKEAS